MPARAPFTIPRDATVHVAGHRGLVGGAVWRHLEAIGFTKLVGKTSKELDLRDRVSVDAFYDDLRPDYVVMAAARVGGILANSTRPAEFLSDNLRIQTNVLDAAARVGVKRLLFLGSSCIYPRNCPQPIKEEYLLTGPLEQTNDAYAIAKIAGVTHVQALRREYGCSFISAMPTNLYGPLDNFDLETAHVLPALIRRFHEAKEAAVDTVTLWGTGTARREFLHVDDLARACVVLLERYDDPAPINVGTGQDIAIRDLAGLVAEVAGFTGATSWDVTKPNGTPRKVLDVSRISEIGWRPTIGLRAGVAATYEYFRATQMVKGPRTSGH